MNYHRIFTKVILLIAFCWVNTGVSAQPQWVKQTPTDPDYYTGVGFASKSDDNYTEKATNAALSRLASSIAVTISAETNQQLLEKSGLLSETFESNFRLFANATLEGHELVDSWENRKEYWVYYRLSKENYQQLLKQKKQVAKNETTQYYSLGKQALQSENTLGALTYFTKAAAAIGNFRGMGIPNKENSGYLDVDVFMDLNKLLLSIQLSVQPNTIEIHKYTHVFKPVEVSANYLDQAGKTKPFNKLPITLADLSLCQVALINPTNQSGITQLQITQISNMQSCSLKIIPDLWTLSGTDRSQNPDIFKGLNVPVVPLNISIRPPKASVQTQVMSEGVPIENASAKTLLTEKLGTMDWMVTSSPEADFLVKIELSTRKGSEMQGIYTAFASGFIALTDAASGDEIGRKLLKEMNGGGQDFNRASEKAIQNLSQQLNAGIDELVKLLE